MPRGKNARAIAAMGAIIAVSTYVGCSTSPGNARLRDGTWTLVTIDRQRLPISFGWAYRGRLYRTGATLAVHEMRVCCDTIVLRDSVADLPLSGIWNVAVQLEPLDAQRMVVSYPNWNGGYFIKDDTITVSGDDFTLVTGAFLEADHQLHEYVFRWTGP